MTEFISLSGKTSLNTIIIESDILEPYGLTAVE